MVHNEFDHLPNAIDSPAKKVLSPIKFAVDALHPYGGFVRANILHEIVKGVSWTNEGKNMRDLLSDNRERGSTRSVHTHTNNKTWLK
mmetsp:Transcript_13899/g.42387  ORF Transcript_13899/g.42387 Transcript_13899/m.42387 type:complete len:87 (+) Transcript_13899:3226-3486(+)